MSKLYAVVGPSDAGPGERQQMLERAEELLVAEGVKPEDIVRMVIPEGETQEDLRPVLHNLLPSIQSGSLFGGAQGVMVVDAERLTATEATLLADVLAASEPVATVVLVSTGAPPVGLRPVIKEKGESIALKKMRERDAGDWLADAARRRKVKLGQGAAPALLQRFGSDVAALGQALDQLVGFEGAVTGEVVLGRFRNRPDEPLWLYGDAVAAGDTGQALRRLSDFLMHGHPLQLLAFLENDLRRRSLAASAPDLETFAAWTGMEPRAFAVQKAWKARGRSSESQLRRALDAITRADERMRRDPEETHRITLERLTVAVCRWYGGPARRVS